MFCTDYCERKEYIRTFTWEVTGMNKIPKVPVIMQMEATECGAASLCMILAYYGKWLPLEKVRLACGISRDGSNAKNILKAARNYGLKAQAYRCSVEGVQKLQFPLIIHWDFSHFVVLCGFKKNKAVLCDPGRGRVEIPMDEFDESFTGIVLSFEKGEEFQPEGHKKSVLGFAARRLKGAKGPFIFVAVISLLTYLVTLVSPLMSRIFMDEILNGQNAEWISSFLVVLCALLTFQIITSILQAVYLLKIRGKLAVTASSQFIWHVLRLPVEFFSQRYAGDIAERQDSNEQVAETLISQLAPVLMNLVMMIFYLFVMIKYSPVLSIIGILTSILNLFFTQYVSQKRINYSRVQMRDEGKLTAATMSGIEMIETIKASGAEQGFFERWSGLSASVNTMEVKNAQLGATIGAIPNFLTELANGIVIIMGAFLIFRHQMTVGMLLAFQGFLSAFMAPVDSLLTLGQDIQEMRTSMERIEDVLHYPVDVKEKEDLTKMDTEEELHKLGGGLELKNLVFGYSKLEKPLIEDFSLTLKPGGSVAFVGASGCGKSTLSKLIAGLYRPWSGDILFDGKKKSEIPEAVFTSSLAVVDQDIILFEDTIADNIRMWDVSIEDFEVIMASRDAQIHEDIVNREGGYRAVIRENGKNFSGGQCQRMEIARVLAQDPTIVILDEATSALDARTEYEVIRSIKERGITCIVVAHRLSTIRDCDEIIVLDEGHVVERGTHDELYAKGGAYTRLISME